MSDNEDVKNESEEELPAVEENEAHEDELTEGDVEKLEEEESEDKDFRDLELSIADLNVQSGTVAVTWCVTPELLKKLADQGVRDPQVVIVTASADDKRYHITKEYRTVTPLKDLMSYVEFRSAGPCKVWGFVFFGNAKDAKNKYLTRSDGSYSTMILNHYGERYSYDHLTWDRLGYEKSEPSNFAHPIEVEVPAGVFAPEPSDFEKNWVNWLFRQKCVDQCSFRRRRMFAYTLQVFPFLASMLWRLVVTLAALLVGGRGFTFKFLCNPLSYGIGNSGDLFDGGSWFVQQMELGYREKVTPIYLFKKFWALPFMPLIFGLLCLIATIASHSNIYALLTVIAILAFLATVILFTVKYIEKCLVRREQELNKQPMPYLVKEEMDLIICSNKKNRRLADLPAHKRSFKLYFQDFKSKVCRPFSV